MNGTLTVKPDVQIKAGEPWMDPIKVVAAGYPVLRRNRWFVKDTVLDRTALLRMLASLDGMAVGDMDA